MNLTLELSLLVALCCGFSLAKDAKNAVVYKLGDSQSHSYFLINRGSIKATPGQGRFIGSALNWKLSPTSLKDYLFPSKTETKFEEEEEEDTNRFEVEADEVLEMDPYVVPHFYPPPPNFSYFPCYLPYCDPTAAYPYPSYPSYPRTFRALRKLGIFRNRRVQYL